MNLRTISQQQSSNLNLTEVTGTIFAITSNDTVILTADNEQQFFIDFIDQLDTLTLDVQAGQRLRVSGFLNRENNRLNLENTVIISGAGIQPPPPLFGLQTISGNVGFVIDDNEFILNSDGKIYFVNLLEEFNAIALGLQENQSVAISGSVTLQNNRLTIASGSIVEGVDTPNPPPFIPDDRFPDGAIVGSNIPQFIQGTNGEDIIFGQGGNDTIDGLEGDDSIEGNAGSDVIEGGGDNDTITGNEGLDTIDGGFGDDSIVGNNSNDVLDGNDGNDIIIGNEGSDNIIGGRGNDTLYGSKDSDRIFGNDNEDLIFGNADSDTLEGGNGNDTIYGGKENDTIEGNFGFDFLLGDLGSDRLNGGDGDDLMFGGRDEDTLEGGNGNDNLNGDLANDSLFGGDGNDRLLAAGRQSGANEIDLLNGGLGQDTFILGNSTTAFYNAAGNDDYALVEDFNVEEGDRIILFGAGGAVLGLSSGELPQGTAISADGDIIGVVANVTQQEVSRGLILI